MAEATSDNRGPVIATITTNADGWFQAVSPQFLELIGRPAQALAGVNLVDLVHPTQAPAVRRVLLDAARSDVGADPQSHAATTRLFVAGDMSVPIVVVADRMLDERIRLNLHSVAESASGEAVPPRPAAAGPNEVADAFPGDAAGEFRYEDSDAHRAYVAKMAPTNVPDQRDAVRRSAGDDSTPMLEIDVDRRTTFVRGAWRELSTDEASGADVFEELLEKSGQGDQILNAVAHVFETAEPSQHEIAVPGLAPRWVRVLPIPSPHLAGVVHALIAVLAGPALEALESVAVPAPSGHPVRIDAVPGNLTGTAGSTSRSVAVPGSVGAAVIKSGAAQRSNPRGNQIADATDASAGELGHKSSRLRHDIAEFLVDASDGQVDADSGFLSEAKAPSGIARMLGRVQTTTTPQPVVELMVSLGRRTQVLWGVAGFLTFLAMQGLYFDPALDWPSPLQGLLDSQTCLMQPLCDNEVLQFNHLSVLALIGAVVAYTFLFGRVGPRRLITNRPDSSAALAATSLKFDLSGPGVFVWLAVIAMVVVTLQTLLTDSVSTMAWIAATGFGAIAAWRADRDAAVPLGSTMAALAVALACLLIPLGIGAIWLGEHRIIGVLLFGVGAAFFACSLRLINASDSSFDRFDFSAMVGLSTVAVVLGLLRHRSWRYAFIGDEWSFFEGALDGRRGNALLDTFDIGGPNDYFTGLTFELQSSVMRIAGDDVWGWRLSALMPMVLSVAAMYAFTRWLSGRTAAFVAAVALAAGHMLLSFSMIGYNNSQSLVAVSASFAALAWAHQRPSALRFFLLGSAVGSTLLVYAMARLALVPIGLLFLGLFRNDITSLLRRLGWSALGGLAMAAPALFSWANWETLLKATPLQAEDPVLASGGVVRQVVENTFAGWLSFIGSTRNTHFIVGPHLDVISAVLLIVGLGYTIAHSRSDAALRWFLIGGVGLWTAINAIQQYDTISNTRSFMIPLIYCVFIGIGASAVLPIIVARIPGDLSQRAVRLAGLAFVGIVLVGVNQWHIGSYANERQQLTEQAVLVHQFEQTESQEGAGMPIYVGWPEQGNARLTMVLRAHNIAAERIIVMPTNGLLNVAELCARQEPAMLAMHQAHPHAITWADELAACWGTRATTVTDPFGAPKIRRVTNAAGAAEFHLASDRRFSLSADTDDFALADTIDIATDGSGAAFALTRSEDGAAIHQLETGKSFDLIQSQPIDFDVTADGLFVVAGNGGDDRVVWYDGQGGVIRRYPGRDDLPMIGGLAVDGDGLWVSDTQRSRLLRLDAAFKVTEVRSGQGAIIEPSAVAIGPDDLVWVFSARTGQIVLVDGQDQPVSRVEAQFFAPADVPRLSSTAEGLLIRPVPERPIVELVDSDGLVVDVRGGMNRPRAAAIRSGELIVADPRWGEVPVLAVGERWAPSPAGTISWGVRVVSAETEPLGSPFVTEELREPGPVSTNLVDTELVQISVAQTWRSIGAEVLGEVQAVTTTPVGGVVADVNGRMIRLDAQGAAVEVINVSGGGSTFITDLTTDENGSVWVLDAGLGQVSRVGPDGTVRVLESDPDPLRNARGAGAGLGNTLYVASTANAQLTQLDTGGGLVRVIALPGRQPSDVAQAADGSLWMIDAQELELVHLTEAGDLIRALPLDVFSSVQSPHLVLVDDRVWVTEPDMTAVFAVDAATGEPSGDRIELARPDGTRVDKPIGIAANADGQLWIPDSIAGAIILVTN